MRLFSLLLPLVIWAQVPAVYTIHNYAGSTWTGDGRPATSAVLIQPSGIAFDKAGTLFISDAGDHRIRSVGRDGAIRTIAGTGVPGFLGDREPATRSPLNAPYGLAVDLFGDVYVADLGNSLVRRIGSDGLLLTIAGGGSTLPSTIPIPATKAKLSQPRDVAVDRFGNVFIADFGTNQVYQVSPDGNLVVIAGTGERGAIRATTAAIAAPLNAPSALAIDGNGTLYIADSGNHRVRRLSSGLLTTLKDSAGLDMEFGVPTGLAVDAGGRVYVADGGSRITVVWAAGNFLSLGIGGSAVALALAGDVHTITGKQVLRLTGSTTTVVAGSLEGAGAGDGTNSSEWRFQTPSSLARDAAGNVYIADTGNARVRRLSPSGELSTVTTRIAAPVSVAVDSQGRVHAGDRATSAVYRIDANGQLRLSARTEGRTMIPAAIAFDSADTLYIADTANDLIRRVASDGTMTVVAGGGILAGDGLALLLKLSAPAGLTFDAEGSLWFTEAATGRLRKLANGQVATVEGPPLREPHGIRIDASSRFLVADSALHRIFSIGPDGSWFPLAGSGDKGLSGDEGPALAGMLNSPLDVLPTRDGSVLVADTGNHRIREIRPMRAIEPSAPAELTMPSIRVLHAGSRRQDPVAPGQLVYLVGEQLAKTEIAVDGVRATVLAESADRLTVMLPYTLRTGVLEVAASLVGKIVGKGPVEVVRIAPAILTSEQGQALALNEDGFPNSAAQPAARNSTISLFLTGDGGAPTVVKAEIGGHAGEVVWAGPAPAMPGVYQANVRLPGGFAPSGVVSVVISLDGVRSQSGVTIVTR